MTLVRAVRIGLALGALTTVALAACGGKSNARDATGTTGGSGGASVGGGSSTGGSGTGGSTISLTCTDEGATRLIGGVRHRCTNGTWTPISECMMGSDVNGCCGGHSAMRSADIASDPCLIPYPGVTPDGSDACTRMDRICGTCGQIDLPEPRTAALDSSGNCVAVSECQQSTDCVVAVNHLTCCACPQPFPRSMLDQEPCISQAKSLPGAECSDCSRVTCSACPTPTDATPRCIANGSGIRSCAFADVVGVDCRAQNVIALNPDPPLGQCLPLSFTWNGTLCGQFEGCLCSGTDCGALFATPEACLEAYQRCGAVCVPGMDQTCNDNSIISSTVGRCDSDGICHCTAGRFVASSGRCR